MKSKLLVLAGLAGCALSWAAKDPVVMTINGEDILKSEFNNFNSEDSFTKLGDKINSKIDFTKYDLVQIKISEVKDDGSLIHYATLYEDAKYKPSKKGYSVKNYAGVFAKYYSESLNAIAEQIGQTNEAFNTNKNWKVEFIEIKMDI